MTRKSFRGKWAYPSWEFQQRRALAMKSHLLRWKWQIGITLTLPEGYQYFSAVKMVRKYFKRISARKISGSRSKIGAAIISATKNGKLHFHCLVLGVSPHSRAKESSFFRILDRQWPHITKVQPIECQEVADTYLANHCLGYRSEHTEIDFYGEDVLEALLPRVPNNKMDHIIGGDDDPYTRI